MPDTLCQIVNVGFPWLAECRPLIVQKGGDKGWRTFSKQRADEMKKPPIVMLMKTKPKAPPHKLGANQKEPAVKARKHDPNFKQSRDVREDRGLRQMKSASAARTTHAR